jgi:hypothetical protein
MVVAVTSLKGAFSHARHKNGSEFCQEFPPSEHKQEQNWSGMKKIKRL